ncbi:hypothetical protein RB213_009909, partial [Colletotrichum asianum]
MCGGGECSRAIVMQPLVIRVKASVRPSLYPRGYPTDDVWLVSSYRWPARAPEDLSKCRNTQLSRSKTVSPGEASKTSLQARLGCVSR